MDGAKQGTENTDDFELMRRTGLGDRRAFSQLVSRHLGPTVRLAARSCGSIDLAEDIAQEAFAKLWVHAPQWKPEGGAKFTTWFYRVVVNLSIDHLRKNRKFMSDEFPEIADSKDNPAQAAERAEKSGRIAAAVADLPERQRLALALCFYEGHSNADAAKIMGLGVKAVESLLVRARKKLREDLKDER